MDDNVFSDESSEDEVCGAVTVGSRPADSTPSSGREEASVTVGESMAELQQKWQRKFSPHLIIKELPPVNYMIQKSKRIRPFTAHVDNLKLYEGETFPSPG